MMALRNSPSEYALINALDGGHRRRSSRRALTIAIGASVAFHVGLVAYLAVERFVVAPPATPTGHATEITWATPTQPKPAKPLPQQHPFASQRPVTTTTANPPVHRPVAAQTTPTQTLAFDPGIEGFTPTQPPSHLIADPRWLSQPTAAEMARFYPQSDVDRGVTGQVQLMCGVVASGRLADCKVLSETPASARFGEAALKLSAFFRMTPKTVDGTPVDGGITRISIAFRLNEAD